MRIDADFPGGNVRLDGMDGDTVIVRPDLRDTEGYWFYWCFRVREAAGRAITVRFATEPVFTAMGPAISVDGGRTWSWMGHAAVSANAFSYRVPAGTGEARFAVAPPYTQSNLDAFLARHRESPHLTRESLCRTDAGREAELLRLGRLDGRASTRVALTFRQHACEMTASRALEGIVEAVLADSGDGRWFRENAEFLIVPFVDKDGVEAGDQGKNRRPHDHGRDYGPDPIHSTVRAIKALLPRWSGGRLRLVFDLHCPWIGGERNDELFFVEGPYEENNRRVRRLADLLETVQRGPLVYNHRHDAPFGLDWNSTDPAECRTLTRWAPTLPDRPTATCFEIAYSQAGGKPVTAQSANAFGGDLAAIRAFLAAPDSAGGHGMRRGGKREEPGFRLVRATSAGQMLLARDLFRAYAEELNVDLRFQEFDAELASLPGKYAPPDGRFVLAMDGDRAIGCVALRKLNDGVCEMKRLFVLPSHRGARVGLALVETIVSLARWIGYRRMVLDSLESLSPALRLYESLGFRRVDAYYPNPLPGVVYLALDLDHAGHSANG